MPPFVLAQLAAVIVGVDVASEPRRQAAAERARDTGRATITRAVTFHARPNHQNGLMLFVPVYRDDASTSPAGRREAFIGWTAVAFTAEAFFRSALTDVDDQVDLRAFDNGVTPTNLMYSSEQTISANQPYERTTRLELAGSAWTLAWNRTPKFPSLSKTPSAWVAGSSQSILQLGSAFCISATPAAANASFFGSI